MRWRQYLQQRRANEHTHIVRHSADRQQRRREEKTARAAKAHNAQRERSNRVEQSSTGALEWRTMREVH